MSSWTTSILEAIRSSLNLYIFSGTHMLRTLSSTLTHIPTSELVVKVSHFNITILYLIVKTGSHCVALVVLEFTLQMWQASNTEIHMTLFLLSAETRAVQHSPQSCFTIYFSVVWSWISSRKVHACFQRCTSFLLLHSIFPWGISLVWFSHHRFCTNSRSTLSYGLRHNVNYTLNKEVWYGKQTQISSIIITY